MDVHRLDRIFKPRRIAVFGVQENPKSVSGTVVRNLVGTGYRGVVYPVTPDLEAVFGIPCFPAAAALPRVPDLAVLCAPAERVPELVRECGESGIFGVIIASAGFREAGAGGRALEERIREEAARFDDMRVLGPNCLGVIVPKLHLNASFASGMPKEGRVAFVSQSGALCTSVLDWALEEGIGFSHFVSVGNALDVDFADLIDYFGEDEETDSIILYVESIRNARRFMTAARAFARAKPIVAYKAGRFPESAAAAASHTGALAAEDAVYDAAFQRAGIARVFRIGEIFDCAELIGRHAVPRGPRLGIVTNAGGPGVMAVDALLEQRGVLAGLAPETIARLDGALPPFWSKGNPVDVLGDARPKRYAKAVGFVLDDPNVDAALAILTPQAMTNPTATAREVAKLAETAKKPILAAWVGGRSMAEGVRLLNDAGIATYATPEQGVGAFLTLVAYARNLEILHETPRDIPVRFTLERAEVRDRFEGMIPPASDCLPESSSKALLEAYGIPVARTVEARTPDEAARAAAETGYPAVLKVLSPDITHKTDAGGVVLDVCDEPALRGAFDRVVSNARRFRPEAAVEGVTVQPMIRMPGATEMILGAKKDPTFGSVLLVGLGGTGAEVFADRALGFPPLSERLARRMLESLKAWPLLIGHRGRPPADVDALIEAMMRLSYLVADYPEIGELDVNPLLVGPGGVIALDARVVIDRAAVGAPAKPYGHLALRPYPEAYVRPARLGDGERVLLRPIKPEDEPLWMEMLASCSPDTIYARFRYFFRWSTHEAAVRYCFIDYDREIAIVAERESEGRRSLIGVGRLVADPDHEAAEYAVLIADAWQNRGLGGILTDTCLEIAEGWGVKRMVAQTSTDNERMLALFRKRGFTVRPDETTSVVDVEKRIRRGP